MPKYKTHTSLPPVLRTMCIGKATRDIDSYALFGHARVHARARARAPARTRTHPAFAYLIIRPESIELRFARLEVSQTALISLCTCRAPCDTCLYVSADTSQIIPRCRFYERNYDARYYALPPCDRLSDRISVHFRRARTSDALSADALRGIYATSPLALAIGSGQGGRKGHNSRYFANYSSTATEGRAIRVDRTETHN